VSSTEKPNPIVAAKGLSHVAIPVADMDRSVEYYRKVFGYEIFIDNRGRPSPNGLITVIGLIAGVAIELVQPTRGAPREPSGFCVSFAVEDIDTALTALREGGYTKAEKAAESGAARLVLIRDPDGNVLEIIQLPRKAASLAELAPRILARQNAAAT
jgi:glyoxylase I family protein